MGSGRGDCETGLNSDVREMEVDDVLKRVNCFPIRFDGLNLIPQTDSTLQLEDCILPFLEPLWDRNKLDGFQVSRAFVVRVEVHSLVTAPCPSASFAQMSILIRKVTDGRSSHGGSGESAEQSTALLEGLVRPEGPFDGHQNSPSMDGIEARPQLRRG